MRRMFLKYSSLVVVATGLCAATSSPLRAEPEVKYAQVGDVRLAYYVRGQGKPLVMINGFISTMSLWDPLLLDELARHRQLILFDNRGVGLSTDTAENNTTIPQMADDTAGLIRALGLRKADILGWSMGARIAQQLLIRHPGLVEKAVLAAPNPGGRHGVPADTAVEDRLNDPNVPEMDKLALVFPSGAGGEQAARDIFGRILEAAKRGTAPDDFKVSKQTTERQNRARTTLWNADNGNFDDLKLVRTPVLVTGGRDDIIDKPFNAVIIAGQIPFAWLAFYDGGHAFLFQQYRKFAETVEVFLK